MKFSILVSRTQSSHLFDRICIIRKSLTDKYGTTGSDQSGVVGALVIDRHGEDEALRLHVVLLDRPFVPHFVDSFRVQFTEMIIRQRRVLVEREILPPCQTAVRSHECQGHSETLLELLPTREEDSVTVNRVVCDSSWPLLILLRQRLMVYATYGTHNMYDDGCVYKLLKIIRKHAAHLRRSAGHSYDIYIKNEKDQIYSRSLSTRQIIIISDLLRRA